MRTIPVSLQLYTLRDDLARDFTGTLEQVAQIGYGAVETAGQYGGMTAPQLRRVLDDLGLKVSGMHAGIHELETDLDRAIDNALTLDSRYLICPGMPEERRKDAAAWRALGPVLNRIGEACRKQGITFCYHNHDFEFARFDGVCGLDILFDSTDPALVQAELDVYWVKRGGEDPVEYIRRYSGRCPLVHLKDMADDPERSFAEVGEGILDFPAIFSACQEASTQWYVVEQDVCKRPPLESVRISLENLRKLKVA